MDPTEKKRTLPPKPKVSTRSLKKTEIQETALRLFGTRGYEGTTLEALGDKLGYTKQALYYYYRSKEDLVRTLILDSMAEANEKMDSILGVSPEPEDQLKAFIAYYLESNRDGVGFFNILNHVQNFLDNVLDPEESLELRNSMKALDERVSAVVGRGIETGVFRRGDSRALGSLILASLSGITTHRRNPGLADLGTEKLIEFATDLILRGVKNETPPEP